MTPMRIFGVALLFAACRAATPSGPSSTSKPAMTPSPNPHALAKAVLEACRAGSLQPFPVVEMQARTVQWRSDDHIQGLYFRDHGTREIAAVVRWAAPPEPAVWFTLRRVDEGFVVTGLVEHADNPARDIEVEGL